MPWPGAWGLVAHGASRFEKTATACAGVAARLGPTRRAEASEVKWRR